MKLNNKLIEVVKLLIINTFNFLLPKNESRVVIVTYPDFDEQTRALLEDLTNYQVSILVVNTKKKPSWLTSNAEVVKRNSFKGVLRLATSRYLLLTHGLSANFKLLSEERQIVINVTHGMYLKNMHLLLSGETSAPKFHYILATSKLFSVVMSRIFGVEEKKVVIANLPRNRFLSRESKNTYLLSLKREFKEIHLWMPTYRKSNIGNSRIDVETDSLFGDGTLDIGLLNKLLLKKNILLIVKPHPMAKYSYGKEGYSNIKIFENEHLTSNDVGLYELLSMTDVLWTDYSSVFVDFLETGKPIIFTMFDLDSYKENRGLAFDIDNYSLPGVKVNTGEELINCIERGDYFISYDKQPYIDDKLCNFDIERIILNRRS